MMIGELPQFNELWPSLLKEQCKRRSTARNAEVKQFPPPKRNKVVVHSVAQRAQRLHDSGMQTQKRDGATHSSRA
jgi:hypothetical protein